MTYPHLGGKLVLRPGKGRHLSDLIVNVPTLIILAALGLCSVDPSPLVDATTAWRARPAWRRAGPPETQRRRLPSRSSPSRQPARHQRQEGAHRFRSLHQAGARLVVARYRTEPK